MSNIIDDACATEAVFREASIRNARALAAEPKVYHTHCKWCGEPTNDGAKFCSYGVDSCATGANRSDEIIRKTVGVR